MTVNSDIKIGGLLLAAGGSTRFGSAKQLAEFEGKTLVRRAAEALYGSGCSIVVAVLGASADESRRELSDLYIVTVENKDWQTGMSSSVRVGLSKLIEIEPQLDAVLITLMDQPNVTASHLGRFAATFIEEGSLIIAAEYSGTTGVPALFARPLFNELLQLEGDQGARSIIRKLSNITTISLDEAAIDIDSPSDLESLESR